MMVVHDYLSKCIAPL
jgi:hypothetical protein